MTENEKRAAELVSIRDDSMVFRPVDGVGYNVPVRAVLMPTQFPSTAILETQADGNERALSSIRYYIARALDEAEKRGKADENQRYFDAVEAHGGWTSLTQRANAWDAVWGAINDADPGVFVRTPGSGVEIVKTWIKSRAKPPEGHILDDAGVVRKVLGTLPITKDGHVVTGGATVFLPGLDAYGIAAGMRGNAGVIFFTNGDCYAIGDCYSTREAAESARGAQ